MAATSGRSSTWDSSVLQYILGAAAIASAPAGAYLALFSNVPTADNGTFTELTGNGYARVTISATNASSVWTSTTTDSTGVWKTNGNQLNFNTVSTNSWTINGIGIYDASTNGTLIYWAAFSSPVVAGVGSQVSVSANALRVTEA